MSHQRCLNILDCHSISFDPTLKMKQNPKSDYQLCTTLIQCRCTALISSLIQPFFQDCTMSFQSSFNVDMTLSQRCSNLASTSLNAISKPIWLVKSLDLQKIDKFCSNKRENILYNI